MAEAAYAGDREHVRFFLLRGAPDLTAEREAFAQLDEEERERREQEALEAAQRELNRLERFEEDPEALQAHVQRQMREQQVRLARLETWLDEHVEHSRLLALLHCSLPSILRPAARHADPRNAPAPVEN